MPRESSVIHFSLFVFHSSLQNAAVAAFWSFLHLIDDHLDIGCRYLTVAVQVVLEGVVLVQIGSSRRGDITIDAVLCDAIQLEAAVIFQIPIYYFHVL